MKVYLELPEESRGIRRVRDALEKYAPADITIVKNHREADFEIVHVIGRHQATQERVIRLKASGKPYAMVQYCLRSTIKPETWNWIDMWSGAKLVWSYYDLVDECIQDKVIPNFEFYHAPLGVEPAFYRRDTTKRYTILATSQHALAEGARECAFATKRVGRRMFFLGHELRRGDDIYCLSGLTDDQLAEVYSQCDYVSGLRRIEGFELPVIEGLMCGARPIVFDKPHYRKWFNEFAVFVPENSRAEVIDNLEFLFRHQPNPVTEEELQLAKDRFNWQTIITNFYKRI
jgi:hypothetical protein